ncbi:MAG: ezrA [Bacillales bacterium]|nr:ezrA [Bacillales bacterium]
MSTFLSFMIIVFLTSAIGLAFALFYRTRIYKDVDRIEHWKNELLERKIEDKISAVKKLNISGEAEKLFENWRRTWDNIVTTEVEKILNNSFEIEDYAAQFRFIKAKKILNQVEKKMSAVDSEIQKILDEVNDLVGSEEKNKKEIEKLDQKHKELKRVLIARAHAYGKAEQVLQTKLEETVALFSDYNTNTKQGNYFAARELVLKANEMMLEIEHKIEVLPKLFTEVSTNIPTQVLELEKAYSEMLDTGYVLTHLEFEQELNVIKENLEKAVSLLEQSESVEAVNVIEFLKEKMELLFDQFENEYEAKIFVNNCVNNLEKIVTDFIESTIISKHDAQKAQNSYKLKEDDVETHKQIEKQAQLLAKRLEVVISRIDEKQVAYTVLKQELEQIQEQLTDITEKHNLFVKMLSELRTEELEARHEIELIRRTIIACIRLIEKSNLPGISKDYHKLLDKTNKSVEIVQECLDKSPLNIQDIFNCLSSARNNSIELFDYTKEIVEDALLVEKVIQYGNRYRRTNLMIESELHEAENLFRNYDYRKSLEVAANAIHSVDPEAIRRFKAETIVDEELLLQRS